MSCSVDQESTHACIDRCCGCGIRRPGCSYWTHSPRLQPDHSSVHYYINLSYALCCWPSCSTSNACHARLCPCTYWTSRRELRHPSTSPDLGSLAESTVSPAHRRSVWPRRNGLGVQSNFFLVAQSSVLTWKQKNFEVQRSYPTGSFFPRRSATRTHAQVMGQV